MNSDNLFEEYTGQTINYAKLYKDSDGRIWEDESSDSGSGPWSCSGCCFECIAIMIVGTLVKEGVMPC